ncbi:MAG: hypothetical protein QOD93_3498 [Acetobacteraceae bacterium]|nr:hypothetical protein [Acetobacteraceae bacterium]
MTTKSYCSENIVISRTSPRETNSWAVQHTSSAICQQVAGSGQRFGRKLSTEHASLSCIRAACVSARPPRWKSAPLSEPACVAHRRQGQ